MWIFFSAYNVSVGVIILKGFSELFVILTDKLVKVIIGIGCFVCTLGNGNYVASVIILIAERSVFGWTGTGDGSVSYLSRT